uniref:RING-type domain-containing protein n=1 Tax=viral metagenome TaxID=1070528 RepID=A0A6C0DCE8_9ZZZZ
MDNRNTISNTLQNIIDEIINENPRTQRQYNRNYQNDNLAIIQLLREVLHSHDDRMREYSENMMVILQILSLLVQRQYYSRTYVDPVYDYTNRREQPNQSTQSNSRRNTNRRSEIPRPAARTRENNYQSQILSYVIYPFLDLSGSILNQTRYQDVVVYPTGQQINNATRMFRYDETIELINHRCPISLADFEEGEDIRQIIYCGHCFCEDSIQNWFRTNVRCPVCRYDIRDYSVPNNIDASLNTPTSPNTPTPPNNRNINHNLNNLNHIFDGISTNLTNILTNYLDNEFGQTNELSYTFEFPIMYGDLSGNNRV